MLTQSLYISKPQDKRVRIRPRKAYILAYFFFGGGGELISGYFRNAYLTQYIKVLLDDQTQNWVYCSVSLHTN